MKRICGGSGSGSGGSGMGDDGICLATQDYTASGGTVLCTNNNNRAIAFAGETGWWCCNCQQAIDICGGHMG